MEVQVIDLVKDDDVRKLAERAVILGGHELWRKGEVMFGTFRPDKIEATVHDGEAVYSTSLSVVDDVLAWRCTCTDGQTKFCEHLVVTALDAQREGRGDIYKAAGIIIKDRRMLVERSVGKPAFIAPGGRIQDGETAPQALVRELKEEFDIDVREEDLEPFGEFSAEAANHPGQQVHMAVFIVKTWHGDIHPNNEVEEIRWLTSVLPTDIEIGSIFGHEVLPRLKDRNLVD